MHLGIASKLHCCRSAVFCSVPFFALRWIKIWHSCKKLEPKKNIVSKERKSSGYGNVLTIPLLCKWIILFMCSKHLTKFCGEMFYYFLPTECSNFFCFPIMHCILWSCCLLLIGILVHMISLLNANEELCIGFALLNHYWCYVIKSCHPLLFAFCCAVLVVGNLIIWPFKLKGHCWTFNLPHSASSTKHDERSL